MHFTCEKQVIKTAIDKACRAVGNNSNMPIISHLCLTLSGDQLQILGTDLNISITCICQVVNIDDGSITCLASSLKSIIDAFPAGEVEFNLNARGILEISCNKSKFELPTLPSNEFPVVKNSNVNASFSIDGKVLGEMISSVSFAAADSSSMNTNMQSVLFDVQGDTLVLVSTDGKRMAKIENKLAEDSQAQEKVIVPVKAANDFCALVESDKTYRIDICDKKICFNSDNMVFSCGFLDAQYPDYRRFFVNDGSAKTICSVDRQLFLESLKRALLMAKDKTTPSLVDFHFDTDYMRLTSNTMSLGSANENVAVVYDGKPIDIAFNGNFIMQVVDKLRCETIEIELKDSNSSTMIRPLDSDNYDYICMPLRR